MSAEIPESFFEVLDEKEPVVTADLTSEWPENILGAFEELKILERIADATEIPCDACDDQHPAVVHVIDGKTYIACPLEGRTEIDAARLARWRINADVLALRLADCCGGRARVVQPGQLWDLGSVVLARSRRSLFLALHVTGGEDDPVLRRTFAPEGRREAVVLAVSSPRPVPTGRGAPVVFRLHAALRLDRRALTVDDALFSELADRKAQIAGRRRLNPPAGARWPDVALVVSDKMLRVRIWSSSSVHLDEALPYDEAEFEDRRERKPNESWRLLRELASARGLLSLDSAKSLKLRVSKLRDALRSLISIDESPIVFADDAYRAEFFIRTDAPLSDLCFSPRASWDETSISLEERARLRVTAKEATVIVELEELLLLDASGEQTQSGRVFFELLEKGAVSRPTVSKGVMELNRALKALKLLGEPFLADPEPGNKGSYVWRPTFQLVDARFGSR